MNNKSKFLIFLSLIFIVLNLQVKGERTKGPIVVNTPKSSASCVKPAATTELSFNMVRAYIKSNGTMWFRENAEYEVPKGSGKTSMFSSSLWIGGLDVAGQLYVAAMRFGQKGNDYWTGPLQMKDASIDQRTCSAFDKFFRISRMEVERHIRGFKENDAAYKGAIPESILNWPATATSTQLSGVSHFLAPFVTIEGNDYMEYNPEQGDYPYYDLDNDLCPWTLENIRLAKKCPWVDELSNCDPFGKIPNEKGLPLPRERVWTRQHSSYGWDNKMIYADHVLKGDETIFWFLNDRGGPHTESKCPRSIGLEIRVQAFAFATNDELNKMTFYSYEIVNRGSSTLFETYFSQWVDPDLGNGWDDFVGCDVVRGLGYCYNGYEIDTGEPWAYGDNPPAVGVDFFQGPYIDPDGSDKPKFDKELANIQGNSDQQEYCKKFVHYIFDTWKNGAPVDLSDTVPNKTLEAKVILDEKSDTVIVYPIRWNNQFAINGVNFGDMIPDNERFGMRRFVYHSNATSGPTGDPENFTEHYYLLKGIWKNGTPMTYGGTGFTQESNALKCDFMFPRGTDICNWGTQGQEPGSTFLYGGKSGNWSEETPNGIGSASNSPGDRRFMQSAGPFTLKQGACNYITVGIPWARATQGGKWASVALLMLADDKCQALFENCFKILDGPDAPNLTIREYDQKLILILTNSPLSNNKNEDYCERDNKITPHHVKENRIPIIEINGDTIGGDTVAFKISIDTVTHDRYYRFEGYQIFQVVRPDVSAEELDNPDLARLVRQYDIVNFDKKGNPIGRLINWEFDERLQISIPKEKVDGKNTGIEHSFEVTQDLFAKDNKQLVNYKTYYFIAIAYAYNEYMPFNLENEEGLLGQKLPYLKGRKTAEGGAVLAVPAVPHPPYPHGGASTIHSDYGSIPVITRVDGQGNGGIALELTKETMDKIVKGGDKGDYRVRELKYEKNAGPLNVKVIDPLRVKPFDYIFVIKDPYMDSIERYQKLYEDEKNTELKLIYLDSVKAYQMRLEKTDVTDRAYWVMTIDETVSDDELKAAFLTDNGKSDGEPIRNFYSKTTIGKYNEQIIFPLGISIGIRNADFVNRQKLVLDNWHRIMQECNNSLYKAQHIYNQSEKIDIKNDIVFENNGNQWITGLRDDNERLPSNWIRAGNFNQGVWYDANGATDHVRSHYDKIRLEDTFYPSDSICEKGTDRAFKDYSGKFGTLCNGTWAPYVLTTPYDNGPQAKYIAPEPAPAISEPYFWHYNFHGAISGANLNTGLKQPGFNQTMTNLYSVNVVITPNQDLWTRCIVLESCPDSSKSVGGAVKNEPRKSLSVNKKGEVMKPTDECYGDGFGKDGLYGMGWFPGYAINIETGERLNIMFSENSDTSLHKYSKLVNGNDMIFNPTSTYAIDTRGEFDLPGSPVSKVFYDNLYFNLNIGIEGVEEMGFQRVWGGMHYVYVCNSAGNTSSLYYLNANVQTDPLLSWVVNPKRNFNMDDKVYEIGGAGVPKPVYGGFIDKEGKYPNYDCGPYDECKWFVQKFKQVLGASSNLDPRRHSYWSNLKMQLFNNVMYTHIPMLPTDPELQKYWMSCDVTYKIRVTRPYLRYVSRWYESADKRNYSDPVPAELDYGGFPVYKISTRELAPTFYDPRVYQKVLDNINIVPNPYYNSSVYEKNALDTKVKIINLPSGLDQDGKTLLGLKNGAPITINIFTVSGILVRTLTKGDHQTTYVEWDLKNYANIPIASGVYIIHVNCPGIGERTLKFFCSMRPTDLNSF